MSLAQGDGPGVLWTPPADVWETTEIGRYVTWLERERGLPSRVTTSCSAGPSTTSRASGRRSGTSAASRRTRPTPPSWPPTRCRAPPGSLARASTSPSTSWATTTTPTRSRWSPTRRRASAIELSFGDLREQISRARAGLLRLGVQPGDRVVAYLPNIPETLVAFAAAASIGAVWASCAPELGARSVVDRLAQLDPAVLLTVDGYGFRDRSIDRRAEVAAIRAALPEPAPRRARPLRRARDPGRGALGRAAGRGRRRSSSCRSRSTTR